MYSKADLKSSGHQALCNVMPVTWLLLSSVICICYLPTQTATLYSPDHLPSGIVWAWFPAEGLIELAEIYLKADKNVEDKQRLKKRYARVR